MPYRELSMIEVREILRRAAEGHGARTIAEVVGADRKTSHATSAPPTTRPSRRTPACWTTLHTRLAMEPKEPADAKAKPDAKPEAAKEALRGEGGRRPHRHAADAPAPERAADADPERGPAQLTSTNPR